VVAAEAGAMIASRRGLVLLAALVLVLGLLWTIDPRPAPSPSRALWPGFDEDAVTELRWPDAAPAVALTRASADGSDRVWRWRAPSGAAEPRVVAAVLAALRGARWHRRAEVATAGPPRAVLEVVTATATRRIAVGAPLAGADQVWLIDGDHAVLVDAWVGRALTPAPLALRRRTPLADAAAARAIELHGAAGGEAIDAIVSGTPRRLLTPFTVRLAGPPGAALEGALAALTITYLPGALPSAAVGDAGGLSIRLVGVADGELAFAGACPGGPPASVAVTGPSGAGCVAGAAWDEVVAAARALGGPAVAATAVAEPRPLADAVATLDLGASGTLSLGGAPTLTVGGHAVDADPASVAALRRALATPADVVARPPGVPATRWRAVDPAGGEVVLERLAPDLLARAGEPVALRLAPATVAILDGAIAGLAERTLWREDPLTITRLAVDGAVATRGAVLGEWTAPAARWAALDALAVALASPQRTLTPPPSPVHAAHTVELTIAPPVGAPRTHAVAIGAATATGCPATVDGAALERPPAHCRANAAARDGRAVR
jgi:hypothetical protein